MNTKASWDRFRRYLCRPCGLGLELDISRMGFEEDYLSRMAAPMSRALAAMQALEEGAVANMSEQRMVGHYWLRAPELAPTPEIRARIEQTVHRVRCFAEEIHEGSRLSERGDGFYVLLVIGIGGSALGAQFVCDALGAADDPMIVRFIDNTDPDGIDRTLAELEEALDRTLTVVISKSGETIETRNGMREIAEAYQRQGLQFSRHAVAVTSEGSELHRKAVKERWLQVFPMWDWVGGRTSVLSVVGLLPAVLQGADVDQLLEGARAADAAARRANLLENPAALLASMWHCAGQGRGLRDMVVLPYRDRLVLFGRYLQQLVMESLGKKRDRSGNVVHQGLTVYGNKGSTDQHAYVQQLRDGPDNFFVTFFDVRRDRAAASIRVEEEVTTGDYLHGLLWGTREALTARERMSMTITLDTFDARAVGALIGLFERAVGLYAELIDVNAYDQPGVEAGKRAASAVIQCQRCVLAHLRAHPGERFTVEQLAIAVGSEVDPETIYHILEHVAANPDHGVVRLEGAHPCAARYASER